MNTKTPERVPVDIELHSKSRLLAVSFSDGARFELPCEYLRVFSRAKEVRTMNAPVVGKEDVNITHIEPQGQYAVRLIFDDGHETGIYSWDTLYDLGENREQNWKRYLEQTAGLGIERHDTAGEPRHLRLLYFTYLAQQLRKESEEVQVPDSVVDVSSLVEWLKRDKQNHAHLFRDGSFQVVVNKQFSEPFTRLDSGDEVGFVPTSPVAPVAGKP
ncbi:MAG: DUF971 domain-containing protein [Gammaproteobacteria bacterium]|nr:DUF971 domain-containing protein [Gammaproteobacteria bacterium]